MKWTLFGLALVLLVSFSQPLAPLTRISGAVVYPDGSEVPTTWWRVGLILARSEGANLVVYREPEVWLTGPEGTSGRHFVDPGPSFGFHLPIVGYRADRSWNSAIVGLEVGREHEFMEAQGVSAEPGEHPDELRYRYRDTVPGLLAELTVSRTNGVPRRVEVRFGSEVVVSLRYDTYVTGLPIDWALFAPPQGVKFLD